MTCSVIPASLALRSKDLRFWSEGMNTREIKGWVIKWHEVGAMERICNIAWGDSHSVARNTRNQLRSDTEPHQEEREEGVFHQAIPKTVIQTYQQSLWNQSIGKLWTFRMICQWHEDTVSQASRLLSFCTIPSLEQELSVTVCSYCTKPRHDQSGQRSLWAIVKQIVCSNNYYLWNIVKTSIGALRLSVWEMYMPWFPYLSQSKNSAQFRER